MKPYKTPKYYTDKTLSEEEKRKLDWEMVAGDLQAITGRE